MRTHAHTHAHMHMHAHAHAHTHTHTHTHAQYWAAPGATCTINEVIHYIKAKHNIASPFKLRIVVGGKLRYLKLSQRLEDVAAMGADALLMNYRSARRKLAKETTSIAQEAALGDGPRGKKPTRDEVRASVRRLVGQASVEALRACEEVLQAYHDHGWTCEECRAEGKLPTRGWKRRRDA